MDDCELWSELCPIGEYRVYSTNELNGLSPVPNDLLDKCDSVVIQASGCSEENKVYYVANLNRFDQKDKNFGNAFDQQPFGFVVLNKQPEPSGVLLHHGDWPNRTTGVPEIICEIIDASGIGNCHQISELPPNRAGRIGDLTISSQNTALDKIVKRLRS